MDAVRNSHVGKVLVLAPHGRDAAIACALLQEAGVPSQACADVRAFEEALGDDTCFCLLTEEVVRSADLRKIAARVSAQPAWSDLPFIVLTQHGGGNDRNLGASRLSEVLGNVTFLERPFHPTTFISLARTALNGRRRQYEARARIEELHEGEERLRVALQAGQLGSWEMDVSTRKLTTSSICKAVFGRGPNDRFTYEDLLASIHPVDRSRMQDAVRASIETGVDYAIEYRNIWRDGSVHWAEIHARLVRDKTTGDARLVGVTSDTTERKAAESRLKRLAETLEERVAERTAELDRAHAAVLAEIKQREQTEELLRQSQKMEAVGQLTGGLAHDFNNLLAGVSGSLELMQTRMEQGRLVDIERYMAAAQGAAKRAAALTHRLLAFSRRQTLDPQPTDVNHLVMGMQELIQRTVGPSIAFAFVGAPDVWTALVDSSQLENALLNLCINARDAMPDGGRITVETANMRFDARAARQQEMPEGQYLSVCVTDTGAGMAPEIMSKVFEPFFTTKPIGEGTGLGLSMIYGFAKQSGGQVRIYSEVGKGTTVCIYLPRHHGEVAEEMGKPERAALPASTQGENVLVVDDEPTVRMLITEILADLGYNAIEAGDSVAGLKVLQSDVRIDMLVTDVGLPGGINGRQLADAGRERRPNLPVLFITGYAENAIMRNGHLAPGMAVLTKPFAMETMTARIRSILEAARISLGPASAQASATDERGATPSGD